MPNPIDLQGLQIRQVLRPQRQLLFYSPQNTFSCSIKQGSWLVSIRVVKQAMPATKVLESTTDIVAVECSNEQEHRTTIFYIPPIEYVPAIVR